MKSHLNLLPWSERRKHVLRRCLRQWALIWSLGACLALTVVWTQYSTLQGERHELSKKQRAASPITKQIARILEMEERLADLRQHEVIQLALENKRPVIALLAVVSKSSSECSGDLYLEKLSFDREVGRTPATADSSLGSITMEGTAINNLVVAKFVSLLRDTGLFQRVELKSSVTAKNVTRSFQAYIVECHL